MRADPDGVFAVPTRCLAVKVVRKDGTTWGLTDHDTGFSFGGIFYAQYNGVDASAIQSSVGTNPGSLQVTSIEGAVSTQISRGDLMAYFYEGARVWVYMVDYDDLTKTPVVLNQYMFTKAELREAGFAPTLEELFTKLKALTGKTLCIGCSVKTAWDKDCDPTGLLLASFSNASAVVTAILGRFNIQFSGDSQAAGYYDFGQLVWTTGPNIPAPDFEVKRHTVPTAGVCQITLRDPWVYSPQVGDHATLILGCPRTFAFCQTVVNAGNPSGTNIENHRGFQLPVQDDIYQVGRQST